MERDKMGILGGVVLLLLLIFFFFGAGEGPAPCTSDADCGEGETCGPEGFCGFFGGPGSPCSLNEDCQEGLLCIDGFCQAPPDELGGPGSPCNVNEDCQDGLLCINGFCQAPPEPGGLGSPCNVNEDCQDGLLCINGFCQPPDYCTTNADCPPGEVCHAGSCMPQEAADCLASWGNWYDPPGECCLGETIWNQEIGECVPLLQIMECDPPCEEGQTCVDGVCTAISHLFSPGYPFGITAYPLVSFCDGCPAEDSLVTQMFLDPDISQKTISAILFVEKEVGEREIATDATIFVQIVPLDGSPKQTCRIKTSESGEAEFDYSDYEICVDVGCAIRFTFCCADVSEGCLIPICLNDAIVQQYTDVGPCDAGFTGAWPTHAKVGGEEVNLYPCIEEITIPPEPKFTETAFAFELCLPVFAIFGLLSAAMFAAGRNPFQMFSLHTQRVKRMPERAIRARGMTWNVTSMAGSIFSASRGVGAGDLKFTTGKRIGDLKTGIKKGKDVRQAGRAISRGGMPKGAVDKAGGPTLATGGAQVAGRTGGLQTAMDIGTPGKAMLETGVGTSAAQTLKVLGGVLGSALLMKLLGGSIFTSWVVYGTRQRKDGTQAIKGTFRGINEKLVKGYAPKLMERMGGMLAEMGYTVTPGEGGELTVGYTDPTTGQQVSKTYDISTDGGKAQLLKDLGETVVPIMIVYSKAAKISEASLSEKGGDLHKAQKAAVKEGEGIYAAPKTNLNADDAAYQLSYEEGVPGREPPSTTDTLDVIARSEGMITRSGDSLLETPGFQRALGDMETRVGAKEQVTQGELQLLAAAHKNASGASGADPATLARMGELLVTASAQAAGAAPEGSPEQANALALALYAQSLVADSATSAGNAGLQNFAMQNLAATHEFATAEGSPAPRTDNLSAILGAFEGEGNPQRYTAAAEAAKISGDAIHQHAVQMSLIQLTPEEYGKVYGQKALQDATEARYGEGAEAPPGATFRMPDDGAYTALGLPPDRAGQMLDPRNQPLDKKEEYLFNAEFNRQFIENPPQSKEDSKRIESAARSRAEEMVSAARPGTMYDFGPEGRNQAFQEVNDYIKKNEQEDLMRMHSLSRTLGDKLLSNALTVNAGPPSETSRREGEHEASTASFEEAQERYNRQLERNRQFWNQAMGPDYSIGRGGELVGPPIDPFKTQEEANKEWEEQKKRRREEEKNRKHRPPA